MCHCKHCSGPHAEPEDYALDEIRGGHFDRAVKILMKCFNWSETKALRQVVILQNEELLRLTKELEHGSC